MNWTPQQVEAHQRRNGSVFEGAQVSASVLASAQRNARAEKELQSQILAYLTQHRREGVIPDVLSPPMNKRSTLPTGWPDFTFAYRGRPIALEAKMPGREPEPHQKERHDSMRTSGWIVAVVRSVSEVADVLSAVDREKPCIDVAVSQIEPQEINQTEQ